MASERSKPTIGTWIAIGSLLMTVLVVSGGLMTKLFMSKAESKETHAEMKGDTKLRDWRIQTVEVKIDNMQVQQTRIDKNVEKLAERFRLTP